MYFAAKASRIEDPRTTAERQFLGVFEAIPPEAPQNPSQSGWEALPAWMAVPVPDTRYFALILRSSQATGKRNDYVLEFDAELPDLDHPEINQFRMGMHFVETKLQRIECSGAPRSVYRLIFHPMEQDIHPGERSDQWAMRLAERVRAEDKNREIKLTLAYIREDRDDGAVVGPAKRLYPNSVREIELFAQAAQHVYPSRREWKHKSVSEPPEAERNFIDSQVFSHMVIDAEYSLQPQFRVAPGSLAGTIPDLRARVMFLHIHHNLLEKSLLPFGIVAVSHAAGQIRSTADEYIAAIPGSDPRVRDVLHNGMPELEFTFENVSLGDFVELIWNDRIRIRYRNIGNLVIDDNKFFLRFLRDWFLPIETSAFRDRYRELIAKALAGPYIGWRPAQRMPRLSNILLQAAHAELNMLGGEVETARGPAAGPHDPSGILSADLMQKAPHIVHALMTSEPFRTWVASESVPDAAGLTGSFLEMALKTAGLWHAGKDWAASLATPDEQAVAWEILGTCPQHIGACAARMVGLGRVGVRGAAIEPVLAFLLESSPLKEAAAIYRDFDLEKPAETLLAVVDRITHWKGLELNDLLQADNLTRKSKNLWKEDMKNILLVVQTGQFPDDVYDDRLAPEMLSSGRGPADGLHDKAELRRRLKDLLPKHVPAERLDKALEALAEVRSLAALSALDRILGTEDPRGHVAKFIRAAAEKICTWSGLPPPEASPDWRDPMGRWLKTAPAVWQPLLPRDICIAALARDGGNGPGRSKGDLQPVALKLKRFLETTRETIEKDIRDKPDIYKHELDRQMPQLEAFADVCFAMAIGARLREFAKTCGLHYRAASPRTGQVREENALTRSWEKFGRCLAPDRFPVMLNDALGSADAVREQFARSIGSVPPPPFAVPLPEIG
ncbi:MAG: hypothetical protein ACREC6_13510 [Hyphomicrobiaceae bacterium]